MSGLTEMAASLRVAGRPLRALGGRSCCCSVLPLALLLLLLGSLCISNAGGSSLDSDSHLLLLADDIEQLAQPAYFVVPEGGSRHLLQISTNTTSETNAPFLLARRRTDRPNPLDSLKTYRGGYNLSDNDYGASVGYTGLPAWILGLVWAALGLILLSTLCLCCCCCRHRAKHEYAHGRLGYILPILALILFSLAAIAGSILLYDAQRNFNNELTDTLDYVVDQSVVTEGGLREVQSNLSTVANLNIGGIRFPAQDRTTIASLNTQLNNTANDLHNKTWDNRKSIKDAIKIVRIVLIVVAAVMLALVLLGLLFSAIGVRWLVYLLVLVGWVLVLGTWILCGIFLFIDNGIGDTCLAMREWVANPEANTSLDKFLPCNGAAAATALTSSQGYTNQIVNLVNTQINLGVNPDLPLNQGGYNQSGPLVPTLCTAQLCGANTTNLADAPQVWGRYLCVVSAAGICTTQGRLTPTLYDQLSSAANAADSLSNSGIFLTNAANCVFVRDVFTNVDQNRCKNLRKHAKWIWIGLVLVSAGNMLSILLWIVFIRRKKYRYQGKQQQQHMPMHKGQSQPYSPPPPPASSAA